MIKKRDAVLQVYVTPEEKASIEQVAQESGLSAAAYARMILLDAIKLDVKTAQDKPTRK
jgi:hypothetical protein